MISNPEALSEVKARVGGAVGVTRCKATPALSQFGMRNVSAAFIATKLA
jgi:hypothetical protein